MRLVVVGSDLALPLCAGIHGLSHRDASLRAPGMEGSNGGFQQMQVSPSRHSVSSVGSLQLCTATLSCLVNCA